VLADSISSVAFYFNSSSSNSCFSHSSYKRLQVNFLIRGPHGTGKVYSEMFKDSSDRTWKFTYLIVDIGSPHPARLMLESYVPSYKPA
jgi:hypothetical protein